jgi:hypothetical protein
MSDNSHYSIVKELLLLSTKRRNFNPQPAASNCCGIERSSYDGVSAWIVVEVRGLEPLTPALQTRCSAN